MPLPRLHKSSVVVGLIVLLLLVLISIPGRIVGGMGGSNPSKVFEHGWPWVYLRRETKEYDVGFSYPPDPRYRLPHWGIPWLSAENCRFWEADNAAASQRWNLNTAVLLCDLAMALMVLVGAVVGWEFSRRRRAERFAFRFGLRGLLISIAAAAGFFGWLTYLQREHGRETALIDRGDRSSGPMETIWYPIDHVCVAPLWLRSLVGVRVWPEFSWRASAVSIHLERGDKMHLMVADISQLDYLRKVSIEGYPRRRFPFSVLRNLEQIKTLEIWRPTILDEPALNELGQLKQLRKIVIQDKDEIASDVLARLEAALPNCKIIDHLEDW
jgi:hypothetical protein